uniref:Uncharacterized protein n=1 Tax=Anopheles minimus TaxID=112268 RepID=A0A182WNE1_9DIPT
MKSLVVVITMMVVIFLSMMVTESIPAGSGRATRKAATSRWVAQTKAATKKPQPITGKTTTRRASSTTTVFQTFENTPPAGNIFGSLGTAQASSTTAAPTTLKSKDFVNGKPDPPNPT